MKHSSIPYVAAALLVGGLHIVPAQAGIAASFHESTKSTKELSECIAGHLGKSAQLRTVDSNRFQVIEFDSSGRELGTWHIMPTPEGAVATFKPNTETARTAIDGQVCV